LLSNARPIVSQFATRFAATPAELWPFVADTGRFNRAVGLPPVQFERTAGEDGETQIGEMRAFGVVYARWNEHPFEWERPRGFSVNRDYSSGPLAHLRAGAELTPVDGGTSVRLFAELTPRNALFDPVIRYVVAPRQMSRAQQQLELLKEYLEHRTTSAFPTLKHSPSARERERINALGAQLVAEGCSGTIVEALCRHLEEGSDEDVSGMRPLELAQRWGVEPRVTLETFLHAAIAGLVEMRWELLCPSCRGVNAASLALHDLQHEGHCTACNVQFSASIDEAIEARFYPASSVRAVSVGTYCVGGPMNTPHRDVQLILDPGEERTLALTVPSGGWIMRSPQSRGVTHLAVDPSASESVVPVRLSANLITPDQVGLPASGGTLRLINERTIPAAIALDDERWSDLAATPGRLLTYPAFRSLFSAEALAPGVELAVGRVGLLFTDLAGSTALYERAGDAAAFRMVSEHFTVLEQAIEAHGGALIKTIGDAVMAGFPDGRQALEAAFAIQEAMQTFDTRGLADPLSLIKIGVHAGACFVVTLNERLDYFGTVVNIAARAQGEAHGGEVVVTARVCEEAAELVASSSRTPEPFQVTLRGISAPVDLVRFKI
jgi:class 3 adenylate cyclase